MDQIFEQAMCLYIHFKGHCCLLTDMQFPLVLYRLAKSRKCQVSRCRGQSPKQSSLTTPGEIMDLRAIRFRIPRSDLGHHKCSRLKLGMAYYWIVRASRVSLAYVSACELDRRISPDEASAAHLYCFASAVRPQSSYDTQIQTYRLYVP